VAPAELLPDLNPIEAAFAKLKALLRAAAARTHEALVAAITPADARGSFTHCGYPPQVPQLS
jgi:transposase